MASATDTPKKTNRFLKQHTLLLPTWRIVVPSVVLIVALAGWFLKNAYHWLAVSDPLPKSPYLIVEGWLPDYAFESTIPEINQDHVAAAFCTGVPIDRGTLVYTFGNYAEYAKQTLGKMGAPSEKLLSVPAEISRTERTRMMARAVKSRISAMDIPDGRKRVNLVTLGTHARRSRQIYQDELGPDWQVGVVAVPDQEADPDFWFLQSVGAKSVITEMIALTLGLIGAN